MKEIFHRASIRKFQDKNVEDEKIYEILNAAMSAPSAKNGRPWEFYVVKDKDKLIELSNATPYSMCVKNAPVAIVVCYRKNGMVPEYSLIDCAIATENILLMIDSLGLGGVMIGVAPVEERMKKVEEILDIPDTLRAFTIVPFGYPLSEKEQKNRFEEERVHYIGG